MKRPVSFILIYDDGSSETFQIAGVSPPIPPAPLTAPSAKAPRVGSKISQIVQVIALTREFARESRENGHDTDFSYQELKQFFSRAVNETAFALGIRVQSVNQSLSRASGMQLNDWLPDLEKYLNQGDFKPLKVKLESLKGRSTAEGDQAAVDELFRDEI